MIDGEPAYLRFVTEDFPDGLWSGWKNKRLFKSKEAAEEETRGVKIDFEIKELK